MVLDAVGQLDAEPGGRELSALVRRVEQVDPRPVRLLGDQVRVLADGIEGSIRTLARHGADVADAWQGRGAEAFAAYLDEFGRAGRRTVSLTDQVTARLDGTGETLDGVRREVAAAVSRALDAARLARAEALADPTRAPEAERLAAEAMAAPTATARGAVERAETALADAARSLRALAGDATAFTRLPMPGATRIAPPGTTAALGWTPATAESFSAVPAALDADPDTRGTDVTGADSDVAWSDEECPAASDERVSSDETVSSDEPVSNDEPGSATTASGSDGPSADTDTSPEPSGTGSSTDAASPEGEVTSGSVDTSARPDASSDSASPSDTATSADGGAVDDSDDSDDSDGASDGTGSGRASDDAEADDDAITPVEGGDDAEEDSAAEDSAAEDSAAESEDEADTATGGEPPTTEGGPPGEVGDWIREAMAVLAEEGVPAEQMDPDDIATIIEHESSGDPEAINNTDSNAAKGTPSQGLMQTIGPTFDAYKLEGHGEITDPVDNIIAGVRYAIDRYGSVSQVPGVEAVARGDAYVGY